MEGHLLLCVQLYYYSDTGINVFVGYWMSDKPIVQQELASELAELLLTITKTSSALAFLRGFWEMTVREWTGIDRLRRVSVAFSS